MVEGSGRSEAPALGDHRWPGLADALPVGVYICDGDGRIVDFNRRAAELWGRDPALGSHEDLMCGSWRLFRTDGEPMPHEECPMAEALRTRQPQTDREVIIERPDGSRAFALANITPLYDDSGTFIGAVNCFQDITARKCSEQALHRLAQCTSLTGPAFWRALLEALTDGTGARWGLIGEVTGERSEKIHCFAAIADGVIQDEIEYDLAGTPCADVIAEGTGYFCGDLKERYPDDHLLHEMGAHCYLGAPLRAADGSVLGVLCVQHDQPLADESRARSLLGVFAGRAAAALELERSVHALRRSEADLTDFFENGAMGLHWVNGDGIIVRANRAELAMLGYREHEYLGRHIAEFHADENVINDILARLGRGETLQDQPARLRHKDGSIRHVLINSSVLFDPRSDEFVHTRCFTRDVTEQRRAEKALRKSEEFTRRVIDSSRDCIKVLDLEGNLISMSEGGQRLLEIKDISRYQGACWIDFWRGADNEAARKAVEAASAGDTGQFEGYCPSDRGTPMWWEVIVTPILDDRGRPERLLAISRNITERKEHDEQLRRSREELTRQYALLDAIYAGAPVGLAFLDADLRYVRVNDRLARINGIPAAEHIGRTAGEIIGATAPHVLDRKRQVLESGKPLLGEELRAAAPARPDEIRDWLVSCYPVRDENGCIIGLNSVVEEITALKEAQRSVAESEERFRALAACSPVGVFMNDREGRCTYVNARCLEICGFASEADALGEGWANFVHPEDRDAVVQRWMEDRHVDSEFRFRRQDGSVCWVSVNAAPMHSDAGEHIGHVGTVLDITERRKAEQQLRILAEAGDVLAASLDYDATLEAVTDLLVPEVADWCGVDMLQGDGSIRSLAVAHVDPERARFARDLRRRYPARANAPHGAGRVIRTGEPELVEDVGEEIIEAIAVDEEHLRLLREVGVRSGIVVPLTVGGKALGALTLVMAESDRRYREDDLAFIMDLARRCSAAIERARLHSAVTASEQRLRQLAETIPQIVWTCAADGAVDYMNSRWYEYTGIEHGRLDDQAWTDAIHPEDRDELAAIVRRSTETGEPFEAGFRLRSAAGEYRWHLARRVPLRDEEGRIVHWFGASTDIHEQKCAQEERERLIAELETERSRLAVVFARAASFMCVLRGPEHVFELANPRYLELVGRSDILGKPARKALPEVEDQGYFELLDNVYQTGQPFVGTESSVAIRRGDRLEEVYVDFVYEPMRNADGEVIGIFVNGVDVSDHVLARQRVEELARQAGRNLADLDAVITSMSEGVVISNPDGSGVTMNAAAREILGFGPEREPPAHIGEYTDLFEVARPDGSPVPMEDWPLPRAMRGERFTNAVYHVRRADQDRIRILRYSGTPVHDGEGNVARVVVTISDITEERRAVEALRESEERFRLATDAFAGLVYEYHLDTGRVDRSGGLQRLLGYEPDGVDASEAWWLEHVHPDDRDRTAAAVHHAIESGASSFNIEYRMRHRDGREIHLWDNGVVVRDENGRALRIVGCVIDITPRKQAEGALRESRERLNLALEAGRMGAWQWDIESGEVTWSPLLEEVHGIPAGCFGGNIEAYQRDIHPDDRQRVLQSIDNAVREDGQLHMQYRIIRPDGEVRWLESHGRLSREGQGRPLRMAGVCTDITERKRGEEELAEEVGFRRTVEDSVATGLTMLGPDGRKMYVNRAFCDMVGYSAEEQIGMEPPFPYWPEEETEPIQAAVAATMRGEIPPEGFEMRFRRRDGKMIDVLMTPRPVHGSDGNVRGWLGAVTDITERKRAEAELAQHHDRLAELVAERTTALEQSHQQLRLSERMASLGTLSAGLGHDMGNLLLPMRLRLDAIEKKAKSPELRQDIDAIRRCTEYMQRLTSGLRLFSLDPEDMAASDARVDLGSWWGEVQPFLKNTLPMGVSLEREIDEDCPPVQIGRHMLTQAMFNLVQNAGEALKQRGAGRVRIWARPAEWPPAAAESAESPGAGSRGCAVVQIGVSDNGPGMSEEVRSQCLDPFFTTKTRAISTGLGLALVHGIVQKCRGRIDIETAHGEGTTFIITLPVAEGEADAGLTGFRGRAVVSVRNRRMKALINAAIQSLGMDVHQKGRIPQDAALLISDALEDGEARWAEFLKDERGRRVIVIGEAPSSDSRVIVLGETPRHSVIWRTLREVVARLPVQHRD